MGVAGNGRRRWLLGLAALVAVVAGAGCGAWALRPDDADDAAPTSSHCELVVQVFLAQDVDAPARDGVEFVIRHLPQVHSYSVVNGEGRFDIVPTTADDEEVTALTTALEPLSGVSDVALPAARQPDCS